MEKQVKNLEEITKKAWDGCNHIFHLMNELRSTINNINDALTTVLQYNNEINCATAALKKGFRLLNEINIGDK